MSKVDSVDLALLALLGYHYFLRVDAVLNPLFALAAFVLAAALAVVVANSRLRTWAALLGGGLVILSLGPLGEALLGLLVGPQTAPEVDTLAVTFASQWDLALPLGLGVFVLHVASRRLRTRRGIMTFARGAVLAALFWTEAYFELSLYQHPMIQAIVVGVFVLLEVLFLALLAARRDRAILGGPAVAALLPIVILVGLFLLGRYNDASLAGGGGLIRPTLFQFDFSDYLTLESEISLSRDLVLLYRRDGDVGYDLLRRYVLSGYDSRRGFFRDAEAPDGGVPDTVPRRPTLLSVEDRLYREPVVQEYFLVNFESSSLLALNDPAQVVPLQPWEDASFSAIYQVESLVPKVSLAELGAANAPTTDDAPGARSKDQDWISYYTRHAESPSLTQLAFEAAGAGSDFQRVANIERHLKNNYYYSLKPGIAPDGNQLEHFLFESRKGYCSYFAFAMAEMVRALGMPARVAVGFFVEPRLQVLNFYTVRADMAHAWVEVYFDGVGWVEFDPTSATLHPEEEFDFDYAMDEDQLNALLQEILEHQDELQIQEESQPLTEDTGPEGTILDNLVPFVLEYWWAILAASYALAVLIYRYGPLLSRLGAASADRVARAHYRVAIRRLRALGLPPTSRESPLEYAWRLEDRHRIAFEGLTRWYLERLFRRKDSPLDGEARKAAEGTFYVSLGRRFSWARRCLAFFLPLLRPSPRKEATPEAKSPPTSGASKSGAPSRSRSLWLIIVLGVLLAGLPLGSVEAQARVPSAATPDEYVADARQAIDKENYQYAVERLTEGIRRFPDAVDIRLELAELYYDKELYDLALRQYQEAERLEPDSYSILYDTALTLGRLNRESEAIDYLERIEDIYPGSPELASDLGWLYFKTRQLDAGEEVLREALDSYGDNRSVSMTLGTIYAAMYRYGDSKRFYEEAIEEAIQSGLSYFASVAYYNLSLLEKSFYHFDNALESTNRSLLYARRATGYLARGELYEMQMDLAKAHSEYERAFSLDEETPLPAINLAALYQRSGHLERALSHVEKVYGDEDLSWMFNFGIDEVRHSKDLNEILADAHRGLAREVWRTPVSGLLPRLQRLGSYIRHRALAWYHRHRYVQLSDQTAGTYLERSNYLDAYWSYYVAAKDSPRIARKYLSLARELEVDVIPQASSFYELEEALLRKNPQEIRAALSRLDPLWERAQIAEGLRGVLSERGPDTQEYQEAARRLYEINPGAFRQHGLAVPAALHLSDVSPRTGRTLRRHLRRAGFRPSDGLPAVTIAVARIGDGLRLQATGVRGNSEIVDVGGKSSAELSGLARDLADRMLKYPLSFADPAGAE